MVKHHGQILEYTVRKAGFNISQLSKELKVNRRTLYNWFQAPSIRTDIIYRIGKILRHDITVDFPELLIYSIGEIRIEEASIDDSQWKDKYISLLENFNNLLVTKVNSEQDTLTLPT